MDADEFAGLRRRLGVTQEELAVLLDVHPVTVNKWERGKRSITRVVALAMWALIFKQEYEAGERHRQRGAGSSSSEGEGQ